MSDAIPSELTSPDFFIRELIALHDVLLRSRHRLFADRLQLVPVAEHLLAVRMNQTFGRGTVRVIGHSNLEEKTSLGLERKICIFVDIIDNLAGFHEGDGHWASTVLIYQPTHRRILATYVALASDIPPMLYFSTFEGGTFKMKFTNLYAPNVPSHVQVHGTFTSIADIRVVAYGGTGHLTAEAMNRPFNGSVAALADGTIDLILQLEERLPHTVVPGVALALGAGATLADAHSQPLEPDSFMLLLIRPGIHNCQCIIASTPALLHEVASFTNL